MLKILNDNFANLLILDKLTKKIKIKRIFYIIAKKKVIRGNHAHKKCTQVFFSLKGSIRIEYINTKNIRKKTIIKPGKKLLIIKPLNWVKLYLNKGDICGVLCDRIYEKNDYIRNLEKFKNIT